MDPMLEADKPYSCERMLPLDFFSPIDSITFFIIVVHRTVSKCSRELGTFKANDLIHLQYKLQSSKQLSSAE